MIGLFARFGVVGIAATLTYFVVANVLIVTGLVDAPVASILGYAAGMVTSFAGQSRFTFKVLSLRKLHVIRFVLLSTAGIFISYWSVVVAKSLGFHPLAGTIGTCIFIPLMSFFVMKFWVFVDSDS